MDKSWMTARKWSKEYVEGVGHFLKFVEDHMCDSSEIRCPCVRCLNTNKFSLQEVSNHLYIHGIDARYRDWIYHGETSTYRIPGGTTSVEATQNVTIDFHESGDDDHGLNEMLDDLGTYRDNCPRAPESPNFEELFREAKKELYPGCTSFSRLSFVVKLLHLKVSNNWSDKSFNTLLDLLRQAFPSGETLPKSLYDARKMLLELGLGYEMIDVCKYDCVLFWDEYERETHCPVCKTSRYKLDDGQGKQVPHKRLRYFPLIPRLQRLFVSPKTSSDMRWHKEKRVDDGEILSHPADSAAWKDFDKEFPWFAEDCRNVRLGIATDGFNPFGNMNNSYSMWPVVVTLYNLPPWMCTKEPFLILSLLIPGPSSPGKDIDVYLRPLIKDLRLLWERGVETYDASSGKIFQMHAAVLWTINDFPAYGTLSAWSTKGYMACPVCNKNICESILGTLLNIEGKTKDTIKARRDLEDMNIRTELHLKMNSDGSYKAPLACYQLLKDERVRFCEFLKSVKFPDGYASNISRCANSHEGKIVGLKTHDCHILLQQLLAPGLRGYLAKDVYVVLAELGDFFRRLCSKAVRVADIQQMKKDIVIILCKLEMIFPPAFFDVMVHLAVHLPREIELGGPIQFRWMYPIERFLKTLKSSVANKARAEGCIAEARVVKEGLRFCSMYLHGIETEFNREERNFDNVSDGGLSIFSQKIRPLRGFEFVNMNDKDRETATWYILNNCPEIEPYLELHKTTLKQESDQNLEQRHRQLFPKWFDNHIKSLYLQKPPKVSKSLYALACGPRKSVKKYKKCIVNGVRFHTIDQTIRSSTQNSGVMTEAYHAGCLIDFYGVIEEIILLEYVKDHRVMVFKCGWFKVGDKRGIQTDGHLTSINVSSRWYENDSFILAEQAKQVFYVDDTKLGHNWKVVRKFQHRHIFDLPQVSSTETDSEESEDIGDFVFQEEESNIDVSHVVEDHNANLSRPDLDVEMVEVPETNLGGEDDDAAGTINDTLDEYVSDSEPTQPMDVVLEEDSDI